MNLDIKNFKQRKLSDRIPRDNLGVITWKISIGNNERDNWLLVDESFDEPYLVSA